VGTGVITAGKFSWDAMLTTRLHLVSSLGMSGAIQGVIKNYRDLVGENYNLFLMAKNI
jgi:hypothetical protein